MCDDSRVPTMCLVCGAIMCSQSYCCQTTLSDGKTVGACTAHTEICGAGSAGMFLRIRECKVVLLAGRNKGVDLELPVPVEARDDRRIEFLPVPGKAPKVSR